MAKPHYDLAGFEITAIEKAMAQADSRATSALKLALLANMQMREVIRVRWSGVDLAHRLLRVASKAGEKTFDLNAHALAILASQTRVAGSPYVFPGKLPGTAIHDLSKPWKAICIAAGLPNVRFYDLQRTLALRGHGGLREAA